MLQLGEDDIDTLARGSSLLGSGGGGPLEVAVAMLHRLAGDASVRILEAGELDPDDYVVPVAVVGATSVFLERLPGGEEFRAAVRHVVDRTGRTPAAVMTVEAAGLNAVVPMVAATDLGLPMVDADLLGRALPRLDQLALSVLGESITPLAIAATPGRLLLVDGLDPRSTEQVVRSVLGEFGGWAALALAPLRAGRLAEVALTGTARRALSLGRCHRRWAGPDSVAGVASAMNAEVLAIGRVIEVVRRTSPTRFGRGHALVRGEDGSLVRLEMENEFLVAFRDGAVAATTPDPLCMLERSSGAIISCENVRGGAEVVVLRLDAPAFWRRPETAGAVGPRAFGYDFDVLSTAGAP
jgi:uncharacterized protein